MHLLLMYSSTLVRQESGRLVGGAVRHFRWGRSGFLDGARCQCRSRSFATWTSRASFARWASGVIALPAEDVAKPHCGLIASRSVPMRVLACSSRLVISCAASTRDVF